MLKIEFDGKETVWCPIGDFFGSGIGLNPVQGWYRTVAEDGTMTCRWVMPYQKSGKVSVVNFSEQPVNVDLGVKTGDWKWDDRSMYFKRKMARTISRAHSTPFRLELRHTKKDEESTWATR